MDAFTGIAIGHRMGQMRKANAETEDLLDEWIAHGKDLERELKEARQRIAQLEAHTAGLSAQIYALLDTHPTTPLREKSNVAWKDPARNGDLKNRLVLIYDDAHDKRALEMGIKNPARMRKD